MFGDFELVSKFYKEATPTNQKLLQNMDTTGLSSRSHRSIKKDKNANSKSISVNSKNADKKNNGSKPSSKFKVENFRTKEILDSKFSAKIKKVYSHFREWTDSDEMPEEVVKGILTDLQLLKDDETHEKVILAQCQFVESLTRIINTLRVSDKLRVILQIIYALEMRTSFDEKSFFADVENDAVDFDGMDEAEIRKNIQKVKDMIGELNSEQGNIEVRDFVQNL